MDGNRCAGRAKQGWASGIGAMRSFPRCPAWPLTFGVPGRGPGSGSVRYRRRQMRREGWSSASDPGRTTAEVIDGLYRTIRAAAGEMLVIGCNTVSHLSAGHFEMCRVGDDTSGTDWSRTRKMGVNTLAFRGPQHGAFYIADADR